MSRLLLLELAIAATILGAIVLFFESDGDCSARGGASVMAFPIGIVCVAKL